jgi:hypothetical protein
VQKTRAPPPLHPQHWHRLPHMSLTQWHVPCRSARSVYLQHARTKLARGNCGAVRAAPREAPYEWLRVDSHSFTPSPPHTHAFCPNHSIFTFPPALQSCFYIHSLPPPSNTFDDMLFFSLCLHSMHGESLAGEANSQWGHAVERRTRACREAKARGERQLRTPAVRPHLRR